MIEVQDKFIDDSSRILTVLSLERNGVVADLEGEIKNFISEESFNNYLTANNFDKIYLSVTDHVSEFENSIQHLMKDDKMSVKTESIIKKLDLFLSNRVKPKRRLRESFEENPDFGELENLEFNYYGMLKIPFEELSTKKRIPVGMVIKSFTFSTKKSYLFSLHDSRKKIVRFFVLRDKENGEMLVYPLTISRRMYSELIPFSIIYLDDTLQKIKDSLISGTNYFIRLENSVGGDILSIKFRAGQIVLNNGSLLQLLNKFKYKLNSVLDTPFPEENPEDLLESEEDFEDTYDGSLEDEEELDSIEMEDDDFEDNEELTESWKKTRRFREEDDLDDDEDYEEEDSTEDFEDDEDEDFDSEDDDNDFGGGEETGDEEEITADEIEEPTVNESLKNSLKRYILQNKRKIIEAKKRNKLRDIQENVARKHSNYKKSIVIREFNKLINLKESTISLSFEKTIKNINTSEKDGKTILDIEFNEVSASPESEDTASTDTSMELPVDPNAEGSESSGEETKTEESYRRRTNRFLSKRF